MAAEDEGGKDAAESGPQHARPMGRILVVESNLGSRVARALAGVSAGKDAIVSVQHGREPDIVVRAEPMLEDRRPRTTRRQWRESLKRAR